MGAMETPRVQISAARRPPPHPARNPVTLLGALMAVVSFGGLVFFVLIEFMRREPGAYLGMLVYVGLPAALVTGLLLIPAGIWWEVRRRAAAARRGEEAPPALQLDFGNPRHLAGVLAFAAATVAILAILGATGYGAMEFMESTTFCSSCHTVMQPQLEAHERSPHADIDCTACHIGPGAGPIGTGAGRYIEAKIGGLRQTLAVITGTYDRPVRAPDAALETVAETCEECHSPTENYGLTLKLYRTFLPDEANTPHESVLAFRVGDGAEGIHWHATAKVYYQPAGERRETVVWAGVETDDGLDEWVNPGAPIGEDAGERRLMTCIDCHNRVGHRIPTPEELIDEALADGRLDRSLPYLKREALHILQADGAVTDPDLLHYQWSQQDWFDQLADFYRREYPEVFARKRAAIQDAVAELRLMSRELLYPDMRTSWLTYPDNLKHPQANGGTPGCFRCHGTLVNARTGERLAGTFGGSGCLACHNFDEAARPTLPSQEAPNRQTCALCHISVPRDAVESLLPARIPTPDTTLRGHDRPSSQGAGGR